MSSHSFDSAPIDSDHASTTGMVNSESMVWLDQEKRSWTVTLFEDRIVWSGAESGSGSGESQTLKLMADRWSTDLMISELGQRTMIRVETFDHSLTFLLHPDQAEVFLRHIGGKPQDPLAENNVADHESKTQALLWPQVSPLAVWALFCSALTFWPIVGFIPGLATVVLLILHRVKVRRSLAWRHSRTLCLAASVFLISGTVVSLLTLWSFFQNDYANSLDPIFTYGPRGEGRNWGMIAGGMIVVFFSLSIHEAAHAITAWWLGDQFAKSLGRVTLNPLAHIDPFGTVLLPMMLLFSGMPVFGYAKPVPVRLDSVRRFRRAHILISIAGPGSNLLVAAGSMILLLTAGLLVRFFVPHAEVTYFSSIDFVTPVEASGFALAPMFAAFCTVFKLSFFINVFLAVFNMIPIPPLDGSWVLEHMFPQTLGPLYAKIRPYGFMIFLAAIYLNIFRYFFAYTGYVFIPHMELLNGATGF